MISVFREPDPNVAFDQSEHALFPCYFQNVFANETTGTAVRE